MGNDYDKVVDTIDKRFYEATKPLTSRPIDKYERIGTNIGRLVDVKQDAYGDSFGKSPHILRILYPSGIRPDQYEDVLAITRILDKFSRISTDKDALGENPWEDICGYALLMNGRVM